MIAIKTILIIEDNPESLLIYGEILEAENYRVLSATDGKSALAILQEHRTPPDLIIMDLTFPFMSAEEFVAALKADQIMQNIPLLVVSGQIETEERAHALQAQGFLKKPFDLDQFIDTTKQILDCAT